MVDVKVTRKKFDDIHMDQKFYVIQGAVEGYPAITKTDTISMASLASGAVVLADRINKMKSDVAEYYANIRALEELPDEL